MNKSAKKVMVAVSALALKGLAPSVADAQLAVTCPLGVRFGQWIECTNGQSRLTLRPNGATNLNNGCLVKVPAAPALAGQCVLSNGGLPPSKSVRVTVTDNKITIPGPGDDLIIRRWRLGRTTTGAQLQKITFTPIEVFKTVTFNVGARLQASGSQVNGNYIGVNTIRAELVP